MKQPKYSKSEVSQTFNLKQILGYEPTERQKEAFYELAVNKMVDRTTNGKDINNRKFTEYSESYAKQKGVTRNSVDLVLNGDMLSSFEKSLQRKNLIKIKIAEGKETLKAYNHNVGDTLPQRQFFGFKDEKQIKEVIQQVDSLKESGRESPLNLAELRAAVAATIDIEFGGFDGTN